MPLDELHGTFLTSGLSDPQLVDLYEAGDEVQFDRGELLFAEGEPADYLWILLAGELELSRGSAKERIVLATMSTPGQWAGGLRAWGDTAEGAGYRASGRGLSHGRCLRVPSEDLGRLVGEWFPFGKHMITGIYQTVRGIEATVRQRESLVALGTLAAGLAHEINNPAAATLRAVDALRATCDAMVSALRQLAGSAITPEQCVDLETLRVEQASAPMPEGGALAAADREDGIGRWLEQRGVEDPWHLAPPLAAAGAGLPWCERVEQAVGTDAVGPALQWVASTATAGALLEEIQETTSRISQLVESVKSYSQMDRASLQRIDVSDGIESTLAMLSSKLTGIEVERGYDPELPKIEAYAGELNQVWTNLIDNAIDAMQGRGVLRLVTRSDGADVIVEISDTGHGMLPEVQARAFEPFFTTKDVGKGTGLGLDISRRIVTERHRGEISFDSSPAGTTVQVRLSPSR